MRLWVFEQIETNWKKFDLNINQNISGGGLLMKSSPSPMMPGVGSIPGEVPVLEIPEDNIDNKDIKFSNHQVTVTHSLNASVKK